MEQLIVHLWGDFVFQSDWMALNKNNKWLPCLIHVLIYTAFFLFLTVSWKALLVIGGTHYIIDRYKLPRYLIYVKNFLNPKFSFHPWKYCKGTGYFDSVDNGLNLTKMNYLLEHISDTRPLWITVWLFIVTDNLMHLTINYFAIKYL